MNIFESLVVYNKENHAMGKCKHETVTFNFQFQMSQILHKFQTIYGWGSPLSRSRA